jgi:hypothetical protein
MQPDGRKSDPQTWPFPRKEFVTADWSSVARAGSTGLILVIVTLAWWGHHVQGKGQIEEFIVAVEDVLWALMQIESLPLPPPTSEITNSKSARNKKAKAKRDLDADEVDEPKTKK